MKLNGNKGYTLVELIVVVAILAACVSLVSISISTIFSSQAKKCATSIDALLSSTKLNAMSKESGVYMHLYLSDDRNITAEYYEKNALVSTDVLGDSRCSVSYTRGGTEYILDENGIYISFARDTGRFDFSRNATWGENKCSAITVSGGGRAYVITIIPSTGAHTVGVTS